MTINELIKKVFKDSGLTYDEISQKTGHSTTNMLRNVYQHTFKEAEDLFRQKLVQSL